MKVNHIGAHKDGDATLVSLTYDMGVMDVLEAIATVVAHVGSVALASRDASSTSAPVSAGASTTAPTGSTEPASTGRRQRAPRTAPPETAANDADVQTTTEPTVSRRRRVDAPPAEPEGPKVYSDVDLSKAASLAAEALTKLGENGTGIVMAVLKDFNVATTNDIPADARQKFLDDLAEEVRLAEAEKKAAA